MRNFIIFIESVKCTNMMKRFLAACLLLVCTFSLVGIIPAKAAEDLESSTCGFSVDLDVYMAPKWYNTVTTYCKLNGKTIGVCSTDVGMCRAYQKTSDGQYMDQVLIRCTMKGKNPAKNYYGYSEHLTIQSKLPSGTKLMAYSPVQTKDSVSYDVGLNAGSDKTVGISASRTFTKNALEINSYSDSSERLFKSCFDYKHHDWRWDWKLSKYSYNESTQLAHYVIKTTKSKYDVSVVVKAKFERWDAAPKYWASAYGMYAYKESTISIKSPY